MISFEHPDSGSVGSVGRRTGGRLIFNLVWVMLAALIIPPSSLAASRTLVAPSRMLPGTTVTLYVSGFPVGSRVRVQVVRTPVTNCCASTTYPHIGHTGLPVGRTGSLTIRWRVPMTYVQCVSYSCAKDPPPNNVRQFRPGQHVEVDVAADGLFNGELAIATSYAIISDGPTFTLVYRTPSAPSWLEHATNAAVTESDVLVQHWRNVVPTGPASWGASGVPVYVGTPSQLDAMGQKGWEQWLQANCAFGFHRPEEIVVLTAGTFRCKGTSLPYGKYYTAPIKTDQVTLGHEVLEFLADPFLPKKPTFVNKHEVEVCDYANGYSRYDKANRAFIPDFVYPSFFEDGPGPWDYLRKLPGPIKSTALQREAVSKTIVQGIASPSTPAFQVGPLAPPPEAG